MTEIQFSYLVWTWVAIGIITFIVLLRITAPYGRHTKTTWGPLIDNKLGWFFMEFFVLVVMGFFLWPKLDVISNTSWIIIGLFAFHYINRSIIFPLRIKTNGKKMPMVIMFSAMGFNLMNGFSMGYYMANFAAYDEKWLTSPQFIVGLSVFLLGMFINWQSDNILIHLRKPGETGYKIPTKGLFKYVSCPNLMGEIIEWGGFAILMWSLPGVSFFIWTVANLLPRAISHHKWYLEKFEDYPKERKAVLPGLI
ncbi:MAG: DUF1295 domain-containing protein [Bacteroidota bacterium]